jgi:hypothetical protein
VGLGLDPFGTVYGAFGWDIRDNPTPLGGLLAPIRGHDRVGFYPGQDRPLMKPEKDEKWLVYLQRNGGVLRLQ